jgi:succinoglycan biosynthesis transport protein ExoP
MIDIRTPSDSMVPARNDFAGRFLRRPAGLPAPGAGMAPLTAPATDGLLMVLWRNRWILLACVLVMLGAGAIYIQMVRPLYTSTAKLWLEYTGIRINPYELGARPQTDKYLQTQAERIKSRPILAVALESLLPRRLRSFAGGEVPDVHLQKNLNVEVGKKEEIIAVSFRSAYPAEAAEIVNKVVETYMAAQSQDEQKDSAKLLRILQDEMKRAGEELAQKQTELTEFQAQRMPLSLGSDQGGGVMQRYLELQTLYTQAQRATLDADAFRKQVQTLASDAEALRQYLQGKGNLNAYLSGDQEKVPLEAKAIELELQKASFQDTITAAHPRIVDLKSGMDRIETRLQELNHRFTRAVLTAAEGQYAEAKDYEEQLAGLCAQQQEQVVQVNAEVAQYQRLRSEVDRMVAYVDMLDEQVRAMRKIEGEDVGQLRMATLEPALPPEVPSAPQKGRVMAMVLVLGLLLGGGIAVGRDWLDQTVRSADEVTALLGLPVLGVVPAMARHGRTQERGLKVFLQPESHEAEAFRTVRTALFFGTPTASAKTMLITSPAAGDGKSTLVSNLAIAIARAGQKTLILDADFRKPTQHVIFELDHPERSLSNVLAGRLKLGAAIQPTRVKGLHLLTCGREVPHPAEVLNSRQFAVLLTRLAEVYDRILIDAPPVTVVTDAQIIGALCDATVLVLRADRSTRRAARRAIEALQSVGAHLLGVVINEVRKTGDRYGDYYGRYHSYRRAESGNGGGNGSKPRLAAPGSQRRELPAAATQEGR